MLDPLNKTFLGGAFPTLGQRRSGQRQTLAGLPVVSNGGSGTFQANQACRLIAYGYGGGAGGSVGGSFGSGGAAFYHVVILKQGQALPWVCGVGGTADNVGSSPGADGGDTSITLPSGLVVKAEGGHGDGTAALAFNALLGRASLPSAVAGKGGDAAGFRDHATDLAGGAGGFSAAGAAPGGGGGSSGTANGAAGRLILIPFRLS
jgi:hypothetical protein